MARYPDNPIDLTALNHSELVVLAKWCGLPASRGISREALIESLETYNPTNLPIPFSEKGKQLSEWIQRHWDNLRMQMPKKICPNCRLCSDLQVLDCYSRNERQFKASPTRR